MKTKIRLNSPRNHDENRAVAALLALALTLIPPLSSANPQNGTVSAGQATISQDGTKLDVHQMSDKAVIDWRSFDIETGEHTKFHQPSAASMALNRVNSNDPSRIMGQLTANGQVILVNPNGIFFGKNAKIDVAGIVATTANIRNNDFMAGKLHFSQPGNPDAMVVNHGMITAKEVGLIGLVAPYVENNGTISAKLGKITLASGDSFTLDMAGDNLIEVAVTGDLGRQLASNHGTINADGGMVTLTAAAARSLVNGVVSNSGAITANQFKQKNGVITLYAEGSNAVEGNIAADKGKKTGTSTALNSGTLTATGDKGGTVEVLGDHVGLFDGSRIDVSGKTGGGIALIGGDYQGKGTMPTATRTIIHSNTVINANAVERGNGGKVIAWADDRTDFDGNISARGGALGGDGGFIETSGKQLLSVSGIADSSSPHGKAGEWLLDPNNVTIQTGGSEANVSASPTFTTTDDTAIVRIRSITTALNAGTDVTITTSTGGTNAQLGNITVADAIAKTAGGDATLTLRAHGSIIVSSGAHITSNSNKLHIVFNADSDASGAGAISISSANLTSNGGNITLGGGVDPTTTAAYGTTVYASGITLTNSTLTSDAGNIILRGHGYNNAAASDQYGITLDTSTAQANGGSVTVHGTGGDGTRDNYGVYITSSSTISTVSNALAITGIGGTGSSTGNYGIYLNTSAGIVSTGAGTITVTATGGNSAVDFFGGGAYTIGGGSATGAITMIQNTATWGGVILNTSGATLMKPRTATTTVGIAGGIGTLGVTAAFLNAILRSSGITVGDTAGSGAVTVNANTWVLPATIVTATGGITFNGATAMGANTLLARTTGLSDITLDTASSITTSAAGNALILASGRNFINNSNGSALTTSVGRSLVYSTAPANDTLGGLDRPTKRYNKTYAGYAPGSVTETGNVFLYSVAPTLTVTADDATRTYGTANPALTATVTGYVDSDVAGDAYSGAASVTTAAVAGSNVNTYAITSAAGTLASAMGYQFTYVNSNLTVTQATLTVTGLTANTKTYDATTTATLTGTAALSGIYGADNVTVGGTATGTFADSNVGTGKSVTVTGLTLAGMDAANYSVIQPTGLIANITEFSRSSGHSTPTRTPTPMPTPISTPTEEPQTPVTSTPSVTTPVTQSTEGTQSTESTQGTSTSTVTSQVIISLLRQNITIHDVVRKGMVQIAPQFTPLAQQSTSSSVSTQADSVLTEENQEDSANPPAVSDENSTLD